MRHFKVTTLKQRLSTFLQEEIRLGKQIRSILCLAIGSSFIKFYKSCVGAPRRSDGNAYNRHTVVVKYILFFL